MELLFYCHAQYLKELFIDIEKEINLVYEPLFNNIRIKEIDLYLCAPLYSCSDFYNFGQGYTSTPYFLIYTQNNKESTISLRFSGNPIYLKDDNILCEGSLFIERGNKDQIARTLFKKIKSYFVKYFVKSSSAYFEPSVYQKRHDFIFIQNSYSFLDPSWCFDSSDKYSPIKISTYYNQHNKNYSLYKASKLKIEFFSTFDDLVKILLDLESKYKIKYVETVYQDKITYTKSVVYTAYDLNKRFDGSNKFYIYDEKGRMFICLSLNLLFDNNIVNISSAFDTGNFFGDKLYFDFEFLIKQNFINIKDKNHNTFYLSPNIYAKRDNITLNVNDYRFYTILNAELKPTFKKN